MNRETNREVYNRTMNNCKFYEKENQALKLLNEIGVLRGISYCLENEGDTSFYNDNDFLHFIDLQNELFAIGA